MHKSPEQSSFWSPSLDRKGGAGETSSWNRPHVSSWGPSLTVTCIVSACDDLTSSPATLCPSLISPSTCGSVWTFPWPACRHSDLSSNPTFPKKPSLATPPQCNYSKDEVCRGNWGVPSTRAHCLPLLFFFIALTNTYIIWLIYFDFFGPTSS